jgi:20S proteasome alpha/beta subunit
MTIAAGLRYKDGFLLCADTQVTVPGYYKLAQSKIKKLNTKSCRAFFAFAGDLDFTSRALEIIQIYLDKVEPDIAHVKSALDLACFEIHDKFNDYVYDPLQMIGTLSVKNHPTEFVKIAGPLVSPASNYACIGTGEPLAQFLLNGLHSRTATKEVALRTAAYVLFNVKRHADGCGGMSQFLSVGYDGGWHPPFTDNWTFESLAELEATFAGLDKILGKALPLFIDYGVGEPNFASEMEGIVNRLCDLRKKHLKKIADDEAAYIERSIEAELEADEEAAAELEAKADEESEAAAAEWEAEAEEANLDATGTKTGVEKSAKEESEMPPRLSRPSE